MIEITISGDNAEGRLAKLLAALIREGIVAKVEELPGGYRVTLTGGH